jgi:hypothetical protein
MDATVRPHRSLEVSLRFCGWLALAFVGLSLIFGLVSPPQSWAYVLSGFAFIPLMLGAALVALKVRWQYLEFAVVAVIIAEAAVSTALFPTHLLGGGFDFFQQLHVT